MRALHALFYPLLAGALLFRPAIAEEIRDYYSEPGLNPFKETVGQDATEHIDPFSGTLQLTYADLMVPGNGGMDIRIHRVYTLPQKEPLLNDVVGIGWTMHFGRIVVPALSPSICPERA